MEALEGEAGERRPRTSHPGPAAPPQPDTTGNRSCPRHWRTLRPGVFPARKKVFGPAFLPAQALSADKAGFGAKGRILPDGVKDVAPRLCASPEPAPKLGRAGAHRILETGAQRLQAHAELWLGCHTLPHGVSQHRLPLPLVFPLCSGVLGDHASVAALKATESRGTHLPFAASPLTLQPDWAHLTLGTACPLPARGLPSPVPSLVSPISLARHALQWVPLGPLE